MNDDAKAGLIVGLAAPLFIVALVLVMIPFSMWSAFVGMKIWNWLAVPILHVRSFDFWQVWGLSLILGWISSWFDFSSAHTDAKMSEVLMRPIARAIVLLVGLALAAVIGGHL